MKHTLTLAAWNFRLARRSLLALWGIFAAQQLALVVVRICWQGASGFAFGIAQLSSDNQRKNQQ